MDSLLKKGPRTQGDMGGVSNVIQSLLFCISLWDLHVFPVKVGKKMENCLLSGTWAACSRGRDTKVMELVGH